MVAVEVLLLELELVQANFHHLLLKEDSVPLLIKALSGLVDSIIMTLSLTMPKESLELIEQIDSGDTI